MSTLINVDGSDDPSYRYKMPRLMSKVEGKGNGVKTVMVNLTEVAAALKRSTAQVTKYFGCEMGAMSKYEPKTEKALVNGAFETKVLQEALTGYIEKFVLCPGCGNPETNQEIRGKKKSATLFLDCKACGANTEGDNGHKLLAFIVKEIGSSSTDKKKKKKKDKKAKKKKKDHASEDGEDEENDNTELVEESLGELSLKEKKEIDAGILQLQGILMDKDNAEVLKELGEIQTAADLSKIDTLPIVFLAVVSDKFVNQPAKMLEKFSLIASTMSEVSNLFLQPEELQIEMFKLFEEALESSKEDKMFKMIPLFLKELYEHELFEEANLKIWLGGFKGNELWEAKLIHQRVVVTKETLQKIKQQAKIFLQLLDQDSDSDSDSESG